MTTDRTTAAVDADDSLGLSVAGGDDGRHARRERNRSAVVEGLLDLYRDGNLSPSSDEIAARAGVSSRSLFRYFDDIEDLIRAARELQLQRVVPLAFIDVEFGAPLDDRIVALVEQRVRVFEAIGSVGVVSRMRAPFQPLIQQELTQARAQLRNQIAQLMAPELSVMRAPRGSSVFAAADALCSFETYQLLRFDQMLSRAEAVTALIESLRVLFAPRSANDDRRP